MTKAHLLCVTAALVAACVVAIEFPASTQAATRRLRYSPFTATGGAEPSLHIASAFGGECNTASFIVRGDVYRCFAGDFIRDPCYFDALATEQLDRDVVLCVSSPWAQSAVRLRADTVDHSSPLPSGAPPWALELSSGPRCVFAEGASNVVGGRRLNYVCDHSRFLFGVPDTSHATWRIRVARDFNGRGMRIAAIRVAWR